MNIPILTFMEASYTELLNRWTEIHKRQNYVKRP